MTREIETARLVLRAPRDGDAAALVRLIGDWDVIRMLARPPYPYTLADARDYVASAAERPWGFAVTLEGDLIGSVGITDHLGYWLGRPYWGKGYATEAAGALIDAHFAATDAREIVSGHFTGNPTSARVLAKLGFVETGRGPMQCVPRGETVEHVDMALSRADWAARLDAQAGGGN